MRDNILILSEAQAETTVAAHDSTNTLDLSTAGNDAGVGRPLFLNVEVDTLFTSSGSATLAVSLQDSANDSSFASVYTTPAIALATLKAGYTIIKMPLPAGLRRYVKVVYTIGTAAMTAGKVNAWIDL